MDPNKLQALVDQHAKNPLGDMPQPESNPSDDGDGDDADLLARGEELLTSMGDFGDELKESADLIVENAMDIGEDLTSEEPGMETEEAAEELADRMPSFMQEGFVEHVVGKERKELDAIGAALDAAVETDTPEGEHTPEFAAQVGGLLEIVGKCCADGTGEDEDPSEDDNPDDNPGHEDEDNPGY